MSVELEEKHVPAWVVQKAVGIALDERGAVRGIEGRGGDEYAVLVEVDDE